MRKNNKPIIKLLLIASAACIFLIGCKKEETPVVLEEVLTAVTMNDLISGN